MSPGLEHFHLLSSITCPNRGSPQRPVCLHLNLDPWTVSYAPTTICHTDTVIMAPSSSNGHSMAISGNNSKHVRIPDMFGSIMSVQAAVNPQHFKVKAAADAWIAEYA